jgi:hypothetical protein
MNTMSERREPHPRAVEQRSESGGGVLGTLLTLTAIPVGWFVSTVAALVVLTYLIADLPPLVAGIGPETTFYASVGVLVVVGFAILMKPGTILAGWMLMGALVAVAATFVVGWTTLLVMLEALTIAFLVPAYYCKLIADAPDGFAAALALDRWLR